MADLYIYYRVRDEHAASMAPRVRDMQARLSAGCLKRRPESVEGMQTWMEVYEGVAADFETALAAQVQAAGLAQWTEGARHTEIFTDVEPCA